MNPGDTPDYDPRDDEAPARPMTGLEAINILIDAAQKWSAEICEYIVPDGGYEDDEAAAKYAESETIDRAINLLTGQYGTAEELEAQIEENRKDRAR